MQTPFRSCLILAAYAFASAGPARALAAGLTARGALPEVLAKARAWQGDAALVHLSSTKVNPDGTASEWKYSFYASASKVRLGSFTEPLGEFVDSDKAMEVARKNGLRGGEPSMSVLRPAGARAEGTRWLVTGGFNAGDTSIGVDAKTGAFLERSVMGKD
jgi:hypothetical protein